MNNKETYESQLVDRKSPAESSAEKPRIARVGFKKLGERFASVAGDGRNNVVVTHEPGRRAHMK